MATGMPNLSGTEESGWLSAVDDEPRPRRW